ncbi:Activator of 90 kDa heat shock protein ATPase -like protein 1 [Channa argus]|uniref:Activator of 90 kDa heat shock protein ATPase-like protein 1 n=1 Tax=Channa argus TaxID=215402 RepID=A0A6G1QKU0_CHAAH|nr:Activator of 90 kDa heat shock protein ATPase -like protein 1 [Channa argus]
MCQVTDVNKLDGEATINNRKGKLIFYEWQLRASWLGTSSSGVKYRGMVDVSNLSDENDLDDLDDQPNTPLLDLMRWSGIQEVRKVLGEYIHQLKSGTLLSVVSPSEHYVTITLNLREVGDETELKLECQGVPVGEEDSTREGWIRFCFQAIKQTFGY